MSESVQHRQLVKLLLHAAVSIVGKDHTKLIATDAVDGYALPPFTDEGFRPDLHYCYQKKLVLGEAKTSDDVERLHSREQYESYIKKCALFQGKAVLLIAVPWTEHAAVNNIVKKIAKRYPGDYEIKILDGIVDSL